MTIVVPDTAGAGYDLYPEETSVRLGAGAALGLMLGDRALLRLAVLLAEATRAMHRTRGDPRLVEPYVPSTTDVSTRSNVMQTMQGISLDTWANLTADCDMSADVVGGQVQLQFGHSSGSLCLVTNEAGLEKLVRLASAVLTRWHAADNRDGATFSIPDERSAARSLPQGVPNVTQ